MRRHQFDHAGARSPEARLLAILDAVEAEGSVSVTALAVRFAVSPASLRRDLRTLEELRLIRRTHGGAVPIGDSPAERPAAYRGSERPAAKGAIARKVARGLPPGATVLALNGGSTTLEVARLLPNRRGLVIVTNSLDVAAELVARRDLRTIVLGGASRSTSHELVGPWTVKLASQLRIDVCVVGADGLSSAAGLTTHHSAEAAVNREMVRAARRTIAVVDGSKIGRSTPAHIVPASAVHEVVTDPSADSAALAALAESGCAVTVVEPEEASTW